MKNVQLLLVEDNLLDEELMRVALRGHHLAGAIQVVRDGAEALELLLGATPADARNPSVILLDLRLPKVDGPALLQHLRSEPRTRNIPVFVLISSHEERHFVEGLCDGATGYLVKPLEHDEFAGAMLSIGLH